MTKIKINKRQNGNFRKENENGSFRRVFSPLFFSYFSFICNNSLPPPLTLFNNSNSTDYILPPIKRAGTARAFLPLLFLLLLFFWACDAVTDTVHEFPEAETGLGRVEIRFRFADDTIRTEDYKTVDGNTEYPAAAFSRAEDETRYAVRYTMEITDRAGKVIRMDSTTNAFNEGNVSFCADLPLDTDYRAVAWVEQVDSAANNKDLFFQLKNLERVQPTDFSYGRISTDRKKAFTDRLSFSTNRENVTPDADGTTMLISDTMDLICPMAKFKVVTTGVTDYYAATQKWPVYGKLLYEEGVPLYYFPRQRSIMSDSEPFSATAPVAAYSGDECTLAFDWVFASDTETSVTVRVEVYNEDNELITRSPPIKVPLIRNKQTIVKDRFLRLNDDGGGGVWIDDRFEGEIVIQL